MIIRHICTASTINACFLYVTGRLRHQGLPETTTPAATAPAAGTVANRRPGSIVAANRLSERHRPPTAVHAYGGRVRTRAQESDDRRRRLLLRRRHGGLRVGRRATTTRVRPAAAVATRARKFKVACSSTSLATR